MASLRVPLLRYTNGNAIPSLRWAQRRWARVHDVRFLVSHQQGHRIADKYQEKLQQKAKAEGYRDIHELKASYQEKINEQRRRAPIPNLPCASTSPSWSQQSAQTSSPFPPPPPPPQPTPQSRASQPGNKPSIPPGVKTLSSYIDVRKTRDLPHREIEYLWRLRHAKDPQSLTAVIPHQTYALIEVTARKYPQFILPLLREEKGAEIHFLQWTFPTPMTATVLFTHLAEFKLRGEYAQPHMTVTHHLDLREDKGLVLLQGSVVENRGVSVDDGRWLLMCLQKFYGGEGVKEGRKKLLEQFGGGDKGFKVEELLAEAENIV